MVSNGQYRQKVAQQLCIFHCFEINTKLQASKETDMATWYSPTFNTKISSA